MTTVLNGEALSYPGCENIFREAPMGVLCLSDEGCILSVSPCLEDWLAIDARLWHGRMIGELSGHPRLMGCLDSLWHNPGKATLLEALGDRWFRMDRQAVAGEAGACWAIYVTDVTPEAEWAERLKQTAEHDELTGLANRRGFHRRFHALIKAAARHGLPLGVIYLDLDDFKAVNDEYGHEAGDAVLRDMGRLLGTNIREEDVAARYGGEEFLLALPFTEPDGARAKAEHLRRLIADHRFPLGEGTVGMTVSAGVAAVRFDPGGMVGEPAEAARRLLEEADGNLYAAKHRGKDCVVAGEGS